MIAKKATHPRMILIILAILLAAIGYARSTPELSAAACTVTLPSGGDIQAAVTAASPGDVICLSAGTYTPAATIVINKALTLQGPQSEVDPRPSASTTRTPGGAAEAIIDGGGTLGTIISITSSNVVLDGFEVKNGTGDLIASPTSSGIVNLRVAYLIIHDATGDEGMQIRDCEGCTIEYNYAFDTEGEGINLCCGSVDGLIQFNETIDINSENAAIYIYDAEHTTIQCNLIDTTFRNEGIKFGAKYGPDALKSGGDILYNVIRNTAQDGIAVYISDTNVTGNDISYSSSENGAIYVTHGVSNINITYNNIHDNTFSLLKWQPGGVTVGNSDGQLAATVEVHYNNFTGNNPNGVLNLAADLLDAENNYWGAADGPGLVGPGSGDNVSANVDFTPWYAQPLTIPSGPCVPLGTITVTKETNPDGGMDFTFTLEPDTHPFVTKWGSFGTNNGEFDHPMGMAVDGSGNVYVVDHYSHRIQKFDSNGVYLTQWGSYGTNNGEFDYPIDVAVDGSGNVYIADYNNSRIQKFDSNGVYLTQWGGFGPNNGELSYPYGLAVDGLGNVYVADTYNYRIQKFDSNGVYLTQWGIYGTNNGEFDRPYGVEVDGSGNVYVADTYNHRIQKFDSSGTYLTQWGSYGSGNGLLNYPAGLAMDGFGKVYVTDINNFIQEFDTGGAFLNQWGGFGSGDGQFAYPYSVAVDESGYVFVSDTYNHRIQKFGPSSVVLDDDESHTFAGLPSGNYAVSEVTPLPAGWSLQTATCDNTATSPVEAINPSSIDVVNGDNWVCTFTNVYTPPPANTCAAGTYSSQWTDILGGGMGSPKKHKTQVKLVIPNYLNVTGLYGQMVAKDPGNANSVRFIFPGKNNYVEVNTITSPLEHQAGNFWYGADLTSKLPANQVTGKWFLQKTGSKNHIPRAFVLYPTYNDPLNDYVNVWDTFDAIEGEVYWDTANGWTQQRVITVPIAPPQGETTFNVELALVDNDKDARPVWVTVTAGNVTQTQTPNNPSNGDQLNLMTFTLAGVLAGTDEITITVYSPSMALDGIIGDSATLVGMTANYMCAPIP